MQDVPNVNESGVKGYEASSWHGFVVLEGTPRTVVEKRNKQINLIRKQEDIRKIFNEQGVVPDGGTPAQFETFIGKQMDIWKKVVSTAGVTAE